MQASVWPFTGFDCGLFTSTSPVASGVADFIYTDNSLPGVGPDDDFANAWGFRAHGTLSYTDGGGPASFSAHLNMKYNNSTGYSQTSKISLN